MRSLLPPAASVHAPEIDFVLTIVHALMLVLFAGWSVYFVWALFRFRQSRQPRADPRGAKGRIVLGVETGVVVAEVILLLVFALPLWLSRTSAPPSEGANALVIRVVAEQFAWNIQYPGADGQFGDTSMALISSTNPLGLNRKSRFGRD
jgi:cytochrome c oxidase subunit 2